MRRSKRPRLARCQSCANRSRRPGSSSAAPIRNLSPADRKTEQAQHGRPMALPQTALLEHAARQDLYTVMTFLQRGAPTAAHLTGGRP
ncbi:hypothetical protein [Streptomyces sp. NPDC127190]|uniref:hypothetical protein n=1 Tax=unclassified Streptomyces TaxID=2593676 RepID=UPI003630EEE9